LTGVIKIDVKCMAARCGINGVRAAGALLFAAFAVSFCSVTLLQAGESQPPGDLAVVYFDPQPEGSIVLVDGELKCSRTPCFTSLKKGTHTVTTMAEGFLPDTAELEVVRDTSASPHLKPDSGWLVFEEYASGFKLRIDGKFLGRILKGRVLVPSGPHRVELISPCHLPAAVEVDVRRGEDTKINLSPQVIEGSLDVVAEDESGQELVANVYIDGIRAGVSPATFRVTTCTTEVMIRDGVHPDYKTEVRIFENRLTSVKALMAGIQPPRRSGVGSEMIDIPAGGFWMGCNEAADDQCAADEKPYIRASLREFKIDKHETTAAEYMRCVQSGGCSPANTGPTCTYGVAGKESHPINCVDWIQATRYCKWAGKRLPTEAEWEKAARGPSGLKYPWGSAQVDCDLAVMTAKGCKAEGTEPVGRRPEGASPYGAMDMIGNAWEWVADWYDEGYYGISTGTNPQGPEKGKERVLRGGSWYNKLSMSLRASARSHNYPGLRLDLFGFRCAL
jgi:formylglycine-generating enzyme required for sulfatase activity